MPIVVDHREVRPLPKIGGVRANVDVGNSLLRRRRVKYSTYTNLRETEGQKERNLS